MAAAQPPFSFPFFPSNQPIFVINAKAPQLTPGDPPIIPSQDDWAVSPGIRFLQILK